MSLEWDVIRWRKQQSSIKKRRENETHEMWFKEWNEEKKCFY